MAYKYEVNGHVVEFDQEPTEQDIDEAAGQLGPVAQAQAPMAHKSPIVSNPVTNAGFQAGQAVGQAYEGMKESASNAVASVTPAGPKTPINLPNPMLPIQPLKVGETDSKDAAKNLTGMAIDEVATAGLVNSPRLLKFLGKGADKGLTSILRRLGGSSSGDIKSGRSLMDTYGVDYVMSKLKAKPEYIGREIAPKATDAAHSAVNAMEPSAMREIGISEESTKLAQDVKGKYGLTEFPTKSKADALYQSTLDSAPDDIEIVPINLDQALAEHGRSLGSRTQNEIQSVLKDKARSVGDPYRMGTGLSKKEYGYIRGLINDEIEAGNNVGAQALKSALDADAEAVIPELQKAKGVFQVSRNTEKAEKYLDKVSLGKEMEGKLASASDPSKVEAKESIRRLMGDKATPILDDLEAQRLAKENYGDKRSQGMSFKRMIQEELLRPVSREYEKARAGTRNLLYGTKQDSLASMAKTRRKK